jgi:hypothetical protein
MAKVRTSTLATVLSLALLGGCTATIEPPPESNGAQGSGAPSPGAGNGGSAGVSSGGGGGLDPTRGPTGPGGITVRRLNHAEYNNTVHDLLGTELEPAADFPADDLGGEFTNIGSALSLSPAYVLAYERAAHALIDDLFAGPAERLSRVVSCSVETVGDACATEIVTAFARRAWRRPVLAEEVQPMLTPLSVARQFGAPPSEGLKHALVAVLLSPYFIFKLELDPDPLSLEPRKLTPHELATRLSYAVWATMPDEALFAAADAGELETDEQIGAQIDRLLDSPKAQALLDGFAAQWLKLDYLPSHEVEESVFPDYDPALAASMQREAKLFLADFLHGPRPVNELFTARYTYVDETLAEHYGLPAPSSVDENGMGRVDTSGTERSGILTLGALLTTTSFASRTSPVKRGEFVFARLLCSEIPPPPPDIPSLPPDMPGLSLRERLELHRERPACAGCHNLMDPIGFGLEHYDAIGRYRSEDAGEAVDSSGVLPDGTSFDGAVELGGILAEDPRASSCVTQKFMTFAIGRLLNLPDDEGWIELLTERAKEGGGNLRSVIRTVLSSEPFRLRQYIPTPDAP